jgi:UPF0755 protein
MAKLKKIFTRKFIIATVLAAIILCALICFVFFDAFALGKDDGTVSVNIPQDASKRQIAQILKENGLIESKILFSVYTCLKGKEVRSAGLTCEIPKSVGYDGICRILKNGNEGKRTEIKVVIPEGSSIEGIMDIVCNTHAICSRDEFTDAVQNGDFSGYDFVKELDKTKNKRKYRLEGYLYGDTYCFYSDSSAYAVIDKMLSNFARKIDKKYLDACKKQGMTLDEAVTLGSIIMREGRYAADYGKISSVFHNRLKSSVFGYRLQSDATLVYMLGREMTSNDKELDNPYNTYKYGGLPPSPICSPDLNAISYALYPDKTEYCYFVTKKDGTVLYARDYNTHLNNVKKATN